MTSRKIPHMCCQLRSPYLFCTLRPFVLCVSACTSFRRRSRRDTEDMRTQRRLGTDRDESTNWVAYDRVCHTGKHRTCAASFIPNPSFALRMLPISVTLRVRSSFALRALSFSASLRVRASYRSKKPLSSSNKYFCAFLLNVTPKPGRSHTSMKLSFTITSGKPSTMSYHHAGRASGYSNAM